MGQSNFTLENFVSQHHCAFVFMSQCARHIDYQLPNESTRVTFLHDNISCDYAQLQAAMALVRNDTNTATGKIHEFEATASFLLPHDLVIKKKASKDGYTISDMTGEGEDNDNDPPTSTGNISGTKRKVRDGVESTGVSLRFHTRDEYAKLTQAQIKELYGFRSGIKGGDGKPQHKSNTNKLTKSERYNEKVKTMVSEVLATSQEDTLDVDDALKKYILSVVESTVKNTETTASSTSASTPSITSILKSKLSKK